MFASNIKSLWPKRKQDSAGATGSATLVISEAVLAKASVRTERTRESLGLPPRHQQMRAFFGTTDER